VCNEPGTNLILSWPKRLGKRKVSQPRPTDGVLFQSLGFDAKGGCYVKTLTPKGQEESVRKLFEEAAKKQPYLGGIQQQ
jgi:hypothetical protein